MFNKAFEGQYIKLDHGIYIYLYKAHLDSGPGYVQRTCWIVEDSIGNTQYPLLLRYTGGDNIPWYEILWDFPERVSRVQKDRLNQLVYDIPSVGRLHMPIGEHPRIYKMYADHRECWIHSARQMTPHGPAIQQFIYDVENDLTSARFKLLRG